MADVTLTLPWAVLCSVNKRVNRVGDRIRLTREYRQSKEAARLLVSSQTRDVPLMEGPVAVDLAFHMPDRRKRDPDNLLKLIHDALTGFVYEDDDQIRRQSWEVVGVDRDDPRAEITVRALGQTTGAPS